MLWWGYSFFDKITGGIEGANCYRITRLNYCYGNGHRTNFLPSEWNDFWSFRAPTFGILMPNAFNLYFSCIFSFITVSYVSLWCQCSEKMYVYAQTLFLIQGMSKSLMFLRDVWLTAMCHSLTTLQDLCVCCSALLKICLYCCCRWIYNCVVQSYCWMRHTTLRIAAEKLEAILSYMMTFFRQWKIARGLQAWKFYLKFITAWYRTMYFYIFM